MWYGVFERATGRLVSIGTELAEKLGEELGFVEHPGEEAPQAAHWDSEQRVFVPPVVVEPPAAEPVAETAPAEPAPEPAPEPEAGG